MFKLRRETLNRFIEASGYEILQKQGISEVARQTGLSRPTIYAILKRWPEKLTEKTPWGYGCPSQSRLSLYNELIDAAKDHDVPATLCKESADIWVKLGLKGPCNCMLKKE